jgi:diguanylate cyclase (GGDEF)-like protein/PAS domain S-box-containing protein
MRRSGGPPGVWARVTPPDAENRPSSTWPGAMMHQIDEGQLLTGIAATLHDCILCLDAAGTVLWASPATAELLGWSADDLAGRSVDHLFAPDGADALAGAIDRLLAGARVEPFGETGVRRDGSAFTAQVTLGPVHDRDHRVTGVVAVLRDLTSQLSQQRELALALEMSRAHFDQAATPQAILAIDGRLESVNPAWCELFGHGEAWFTDRALLDLVHPIDVDEVMARMARLRVGTVDSISYRGMFRLADGDGVRLLLDASLLREPGGRPYAIAAWVADDDVDEDHPNLAHVLARRAWDAAVVLDEDVTVRFAAAAVTRMLGFSREDLIGRPVAEYVHPSDADRVRQLVDRLRAEPRTSERAVVRIRDAEARWRSMEITARNCLDDPDIRGIVANLRDVTDRVRTEEALRLSEELHRAMVESTLEGILATSPAGLVIFANETAVDTLSRSAEQLHGEDPVRLLGLREDTRVDAGTRAETHEVVYRRPDGDERRLRVFRRPLNSRNERLGHLVSLSDVTDVRRTEDALRSRALHDPLTGLPNRYLFLDRLETAAVRHERNGGHGTAVLFLDVDRFKSLNDGFGHVAGDDALREIGNRLLATVRVTDTVGRLGGDEFAVVCEDTDLHDAQRVADRILTALAEPVVVDGVEHRVTVSVGIATAPPCTFDEVIRRADQAMYRAKQQGGGRVGVDGREDATVA